MNTHTTTFYGTAWCPDCQRAKKLLGEYNIEYDYIDIDKDVRAAAFVEEVNNGQKIIPTIILPDGRRLVEPSNQELLEAFGLQAKVKEHYCDLIIIGGGPAGLTAAIYTTREGIETTILESKIPGGQAAITDVIDNYPGFPNGVNGQSLSEDLVKQAKRFGAKIINEEVKKLTDGSMYKRVETASSVYYAKAVIIATGSDYKRSGAKGEDKLLGRGIHFCATCDGPFYKGKTLAIIGSGNSAFQEGLFLSRFASHITFLIRGDQVKASDVLKQKVKEMSSMFSLHFNTEVVEFSGEQKLEQVIVRNTKTGKQSSLIVDGVFVFIGLIPNTHFLQGAVDLDTAGFIKTQATLETSMPGVFAAGDNRQGATAQIASAVGEGATAALMVRQFLEKK